MATRKEQINEYKLRKFKAGVFQIRNTVNGKIYLDNSTNLESIYNRHRTELNFGSHRNQGLQHDWKTFGEENFVYEILSELNQDDDTPAAQVQKDLKALEAMFMEELAPYGEKGYHQAPRQA